MQLTSPSTIKELLSKHGATPKKSLGQNFLVNKGVVEKLVRVADIGPQDTVLEVGPGIGALTQELAKKARRVVAVEKDAKMAEVLQETIADFSNVEVVHADILSPNLFPRFPRLSLVETRLSLGIPEGSYKVVANLPYYITAPVIRMFLEAKRAPKLMALMVQKEVAQRICAKPPHMNLLALSVQFYAAAKIEGYVKKGSFWTQPAVDSAILAIAPKERLKTHDRESIAAEQFFRVVKAGFLHPRRKVSSNLAKGLGLEKTEAEQALQAHGISPARRAETLSVQEWNSLAKRLL